MDQIFHAVLSYHEDRVLVVTEDSLFSVWTLTRTTKAGLNRDNLDVLGYYVDRQGSLDNVDLSRPDVTIVVRTAFPRILTASDDDQNNGAECR